MSHSLPRIKFKKGFAPQKLFYTCFAPGRLSSCKEATRKTKQTGRNKANQPTNQPNNLPNKQTNKQPNNQTTKRNKSPNRQKTKQPNIQPTKKTNSSNHTKPNQNIEFAHVTNTFLCFLGQPRRAQIQCHLPQPSQTKTKQERSKPNKPNKSTIHQTNRPTQR